MFSAVEAAVDLCVIQGESSGLQRMQTQIALACLMTKTCGRCVHVSNVIANTSF